METITEMEYIAFAAEMDAKAAGSSDPPKQMTDSQTETDLEDLVHSGGGGQESVEDLYAGASALERRDDTAGDILPSQSHPFLGESMGTTGWTCDMDV